MLSKVVPIDPLGCVFDIGANFSITMRAQGYGPPERVDAMTLGIVTMERSAPHGGEIHPDGDELLYVISGKVEVTCDSSPGESHIFGPGQGCIIKQGEWHKVNVLEKTQLLHATPGPNGDHRPQS